MENIHLDEKKEENTNNKYSNLLTLSDSTCAWKRALPTF